MGHIIDVHLPAATNLFKILDWETKLMFFVECPHDNFDTDSPMSAQEGNGDPVFLLALDGGGVRGISEAVILHEIMSRLQTVAGLKELPKPCDYFDLIGGTSTGGLIAIMLGRLRMDTRQVLDKYEDLAERVFKWTNRRFLDSQWSFKEKALKHCLDETIQQCGLGSCMDESPLETDKGRTFTVAVQKGADENTPSLFRSYQTQPKGRSYEIWQAARATTAAPRYFRSAKFTFGKEEEIFIDGAVKWNNPAQLVLREAGSCLGQERRFGCLLSLGTGIPPNILMPNGGKYVGPWIELAKMAKKFITDPEPIHRELRDRFQEFPDSYKRLDLPWKPGKAKIKVHYYKKMEALRQDTEEYLREPSVSLDIDQIVEVLHKKQSSGLTLRDVCFATSLAAEVQQIERLTERRTPVSPIFTGRSEVQKVLDGFFCERPAGSSPRRQFKLCGMGGVGKTQIALRFMNTCRTGGRFPSNRMFWIDASAASTILHSFRSIWDRVSDGRQPFHLDLVRQWFTDSSEEWLLVIDNYDDGDISGYLPDGDTGNILYTTRNSELSPRLDKRFVNKVIEMEESEAMLLLLRSAHLEDDKSQRLALVKEGIPLVHELGCLPLALDQAGAYVSSESCTFAEYLSRYRKQRAQLLKDPLYRGTFESNRSVYDTFELSFSRLKAKATGTSAKALAAESALRILNVFCFYHNEGILKDIIRRAAINPQCDRDVLEIPPDISGEVFSPKKLLDILPDGTWAEDYVNSGLSLLKSYSLIKENELEQGDYSMHVLVHSWARDRMPEPVWNFQLRAARSIVYDSVQYGITGMDCNVLGKLLAHMEASVQLDPDVEVVFEKKTGQEQKFGIVLGDLGMWERAAYIFQGVALDRQPEFGRDHPDTIVALIETIRALVKAGHWNMAEEYCNATLERIAHCGVPDWGAKKRRIVKRFLAKAYRRQLRFEDQRIVLEELIDEHDGPFDRAMISDFEDLANLHWRRGNKDIALEISEKLVNYCLKSPRYGPSHSVTVRLLRTLPVFQGNENENDLDKAEAQRREDLRTSISQKGVDHPRSLANRDAVARICEQIGGEKLDEAENLRRELVELSTCRLGEKHPHTLLYSYNLANLLLKRTKFEEGYPILEKTFERFKDTYGHNHPATINVEVETSIWRKFVEVERDLSRGDGRDENAASPPRRYVDLKPGGKKEIIREMLLQDPRLRERIIDSIQDLSRPTNPRVMAGRIPDPGSE